jgi:hypothetical protein
MTERISENHKAVLDKIGDLPLVRMTGGMWTYQGCPTHKGGFTGMDIPDWHVGTNTVRAMERHGLLKRTNKYPEEWIDSRVAAR